MPHTPAHMLRTVLLSAGLVVCLRFPAAAQTTQETAQKIARANALVQQGKPEAAIPIYKQLVAAYPSEPSIGANLAIAQFKAALYQDAIQECHRVLRLRPNLFPALLFLGASHLKLREAASAVEPLRQALAINPSDPNARIMLADAFLGNQEFREAAAQYELASETMPDSPRVWYGLYRSYETFASELLVQLEKDGRASAGFLALSGDFEKDSLQFARAFQHYRQALTIRPAFRGLHAKLAEIYQLTGHPDWAMAEGVRENAPPCESNSLECNFVAGRVNEAAAATSVDAESLYWQALAVRTLSQRAYAKLQNDLPPSRERYEAAAEYAEHSARYREAAVDWRQALTLAPEDSEIQRRLALAMCHANDCISALPLLKELLAKAPASAELNYLSGLALNATRDPAGALPYLQKAIQLDTKFLPARAALGEALLEAGNPEQAIAHLEAATAEDESGVRRYQLARAYQAAGKRERAQATLREYREILSRRAASENDEPRITAP